MTSFFDKFMFFMRDKFGQAVTAGVLAFMMSVFVFGFLAIFLNDFSAIEVIPTSIAVGGGTWLGNAIAIFLFGNR
jgi:uncharacterized protein YegL